MKITFPDWWPERWADLPQNPLTEPPNGYVIGDRQIILPGKHDSFWHMFAYGKGASIAFAQKTA